jgi:hypothetical protein
MSFDLADSGFFDQTFQSKALKQTRGTANN